MLNYPLCASTHNTETRDPTPPWLITSVTCMRRCDSFQDSKIRWRI